jgi:hypothetical protein
MRRVPLVPFALAFAFAAGCAPDFDNRTTIKDLRVLSVTAEPPEILVDMPALADEIRRQLPTATDAQKAAWFAQLPAALADLAAQMKPVTLTPLVVDPRGGGRAVQYRIVVCANSFSNSGVGGGNNANPAGGGPGDVRDTVSRQACPANAEVLAEGSAAGGADGVVPIAVTFTPSQALLGAAIASDPSGTWIGTPITVGLTVTAGSEQVVGIKRVIIMRRLDPAEVANQNPVVPMLLHRRDKTVDPMPFLPAEAPLEVPFGGKVNIVAAPAQTEPYSAPAYARGGGAEIIEVVPKETLRYAFYTTAGTFSPGQVATDNSPILTNQKHDLESTYEAPLRLMPGVSPDVVVFVVVRDERGGASYIQTRLHLH